MRERSCATRDRYRLWDHPELTFAGVADVDERDRVRGEELVEVGRHSSLCLLDQIGQLDSEVTVGADREVSGCAIGADAGQAHRRALLFAGVGDENDLLADVGDHPAGLGESAVESHVDRTAQMSGGEVVGERASRTCVPPASSARSSAALTAGMCRCWSSNG